MALGDIYNLRLEGAYLGSTFVNSYWYRCDSVGSGVGSQNLVDSFENNDMPEFGDFCNTHVDFTLISCVNYGNPTDFFATTPTITAGQRTGTSDPAPSFLTGSIQFNRNGPGTRYSYKRIVGLLEEDIEGNDLEAAAITLLAGIATANANQHLFGAWVFTSVQVRQPTPGTGGLGINPQVNFSINTTLRIFLGTQNSRKV